MTPAARHNAAIDILDELYHAWADNQRLPADTLLNNYFHTRRYMGSKDRGEISKLVYFVLRHKLMLEWWCERIGLDRRPRALVLVALCLHLRITLVELNTIWNRDDKYSPPPVNKNENKALSQLGHALVHSDMPAHVQGNYPEWMEPYLKEVFGEELQQAMQALNQEAPVDLRTNTLKCTPEQLQVALQQEAIETVPTDISPLGLRLPKRRPVFATNAFKNGWFEMQDEGSQLAALLVDAKEGQKVIDFCAGAGGKTLALAASMNNKGRILAWDVSAKRLQQITQRLKRAGVHNVSVNAIESENDSFIKRHKHSADRVLVDAPCSGTGTWRRNPDLKWRFNESDLHEIVALQQRVLHSASRLVKQGGQLIYATCSLLKNENEKCIEQFLAIHPNFRVVIAQEMWNKIPVKKTIYCGNYLRLTPHQDGTDGFFVAILENVQSAVETE